MSDTLRILRKTIGNFLEDFRPRAHVFRHKGGKTVTEGLFTTFTEFSMTTNPLCQERPLRAGLRLRGLTSARPAS